MAKKLPCLYYRSGKRGWNFEPSGAMRRAGFSGKAFGEAEAEARAYVTEQLDDWKRIQEGNKPEPKARAGTFRHLVAQFEKDPVWYGKLGKRTQEQADQFFTIIADTFDDAPVRLVQRRHCRGFYNNMRLEGSEHKAVKAQKWLHRLLEYAVEMGLREDNPANRLKVERPAPRAERWTPEEVQAVINAALKGGVHPKSHNVIEPRPSIALATRIAYDTSLPQADVLRLRWEQFDGQGFEVKQQKKRADKVLWIPVSEEAVAMLEETERTSPFIIVSEQTQQPYLDEPGRKTDSARNVFSRLFRRFKKRAGIERDITFQDLRRTALTELGEEGATNAEIVSFSGHSVNSKILDVYVKPDKGAALNAAQKRWNKEK